MKLDESVTSIKSIKHFENLENRFNIIHKNKYDYSKVIYLNNKTNITIICKKHNIIFKQKPNNHLNGQGCKLCGNEKTINSNKFSEQEFLEKCVNVHGDTYDYSKVEYINISEHIIIICKIHGEFKQTPDVHLRGCGCPSCGGIASNKNRFLTKEIFIDRSILIHLNQYDYSLVNEVSSGTKVIIICDTHGEFSQLPHSHMAGAGCPKCKGLKISTALMYNNEKIILQCIEKHGNKYDYSLVEYSGAKNKIKIICKEHGIFEQVPSNHLIGQGCPKCSKEKSEYDKYKDKLTTLYYIKINRKYFKIGLTQKTVDYRFSYDIKNNVDIEIIKTFVFTDGLYALIIEQYVLSQTKHFMINKEESPIGVGWTELRNNCVLNILEYCVNLYKIKELNEQNK